MTLDTLFCILHCSCTWQTLEKDVTQALSRGITSWRRRPHPAQQTLNDQCHMVIYHWEAYCTSPSKTNQKSVHHRWRVLNSTQNILAIRRPGPWESMISPQHFSCTSPASSSFRFVVPVSVAFQHYFMLRLLWFILLSAAPLCWTHSTENCQGP